MGSFINIHTHTLCKNSNICIKNIAFAEEIKKNLLESSFFSIGLHPWDIEKVNLSTYFAKLEQIVQNEKVIAVGEIGLDRVIKTDFLLQKKVFLEQLTLAENLSYPVIIHCVKAYSDILQILKKGKYSIPIIFHDFRANLQIFKQLETYNTYFSFGKSLFSAQAKINTYFKNIPLKRIFFETDEAEIKIEDVYLQAHKMKNIDLLDLQLQIENNFKAIFLTTKLRFR